MEINEKFLHIGKLPIPPNFPMAHDAMVQIRIIGIDEVYHLECVKVEYPQNKGDGTQDVVYKLKHSF